MDSLVETLNQLLADPNTSFEEKKYYIEIIQKTYDKKMEFDKNNKNFILGVLGIAVAVLAIPLAIIFGMKNENKNDTDVNSDDTVVNSDVNSDDIDNNFL